MSVKGVGTAEYAARWAGILLALAALATVVAVVGRVSADADQPTLMGRSLPFRRTFSPMESVDWQDWCLGRLWYGERPCF